MTFHSFFFPKSSIQLHVLSDYFFFFPELEGVWNGQKISVSFQKHRTLFLSNFSRYSICFGAGRTKCGTRGATQKNSPVRGSGKRGRVSQVCGNQTIPLIWSRLVNFFLCGGIVFHWRGKGVSFLSDLSCLAECPFFPGC